MIATESPPSVDTVKPIRVLVVEDSDVERRMLVALLETDPDLEIVGLAANGTDAIRAAVRLLPDVITMDLRMPIMDVLEATRQIMRVMPCPIVLVTAYAVPDDDQFSRDALRAGVLAIIQKPSLGTADTAPAAELLRVVKSMAEIKTVRHWSPDRLVRTAPATGIRESRKVANPIDIVAIGASTGGPQALFEILSRLPGDFAIPVLVVQHISPGFATTLVDWLKPLCPLPIQLAATGMSLDRPGIVVAPSDQHLVVAGHRVLLTSTPPVGQHRPAATLLFQSVARDYGRGAVGVLLSGMGDDGAIGLRDLKGAGGITIGQDESSSVVFGMAAVAIGLGVVDSVLPPAEIARLLLHLGQFGRETG